ncbi:MAG: hypothetical protein ABJ205_07875 [Erythrobacter sp.]|uniref:hypothetical protein n=1 Tax=Erythrobacter sp. TaxID=1042 RepID=UPI003262F509
MIRTFTPKLVLSSGIAALALLGASPTIAEDVPQDTQADSSEEMSKGEARLARLLEGRVAGEPRDCIREFRSSRMQTINETAYVYGRGDTIYVQRTRHPDDIDDDDVLVIRKTSSTQLCRLDFITSVDRFSGFFTGGVQFDKFVPYTRVDEEQL